MAFWYDEEGWPEDPDEHPALSGSPRNIKKPLKISFAWCKYLRIAKILRIFAARKWAGKS